MLKRVLGLLGWLGVALVFTARRHQVPASRSGSSAYSGLAIAGLVCTLLYILSQWREIARAFSGREARFGTLAVASIARRPGDPGRAQLPGGAPQQALGPDRGEAVHAVGADAEGAAEPRQAGEHQGVRDVGGLRALPRAARRVHVRVDAGLDRVHRRGEAAVARQPVQGRSARHGRHRIRRARRARHVGRRAGTGQRPGQGRPGHAAQGLLRPGPRRARHRRLRPAGLQHHQVLARLGQLHGREAGARAAERGAGRRLRAGRRRDRRPTSSRPRSTCSRSISRRGGKILFLLDPPDRADSPPLTGLIALLQRLGHRDRHQRRRRRERNGTAVRHRRRSAGRREVQPARDHRRFPADHGVSARAVGRRGHGEPRTAASRRRWSKRARAVGPRPTSRS